MKRLVSLWTALEDRPRLRGVAHELRAVLGEEYDAAQQFLQPNGEEAARFPCRFPSGPGCPRHVIKDEDGSIRAVCGCTPHECESISLIRPDVQIRRFDNRPFARCLQELLGVKPTTGRIDGLGDLFELGTLRRLSAARQPVVVLLPSSTEVAAALVAVVQRSYRKGCILLTPTDRFISHQDESCFVDAAIKWLVLADLIVIDSNKLVAKQTLEDALKYGVARDDQETEAALANKPRRGFAANEKDHVKVVRAVAVVGKDWSRRLPEACREIGKAGAVFPDHISKADCVDSWDDLADDIRDTGTSAQKERVQQYVRYRIRWVREFRPNEESLTKVSRLRSR